MKIIHLILLICFSITLYNSYSQFSDVHFETSKMFKTEEAHQGIAVGKDYFYTINSRGLGKYNKNSGEFISEWKDTTGQIIHLDGGVIVDEKLYCAHSNYPGIPMTSSIEIFDKHTLKHFKSHSFGTKNGSCTWADYYDNSWWVCFSHYDKFEQETGKDNSWTVLVKFDKKWIEQKSWVFPENVLSEFKPMSCSGGSWGPDGNLYVTGHDSTKVYVLQLPEIGSTLNYVKTMRIDFNGQGIAWDRYEKDCLYGIIRKQNLVVKSRLAIN